MISSRPASAGTSIVNRVLPLTWTGSTTVGWAASAGSACGNAARIASERGTLPRALAEPLVLMVAPLAPHIAEELWARLGHPGSLAYEAFPEADPALVAEATVVLPVQINGKTRLRIEVPADAGRDRITSILMEHPELARHLEGATVDRVVVVPGRIANVVTR